MLLSGVIYSLTYIYNGHLSVALDVWLSYVHFSTLPVYPCGPFRAGGSRTRDLQSRRLRTVLRTQSRTEEGTWDG